MLDKVTDKVNETLKAAKVADASQVEALKSEIATLKAADKSGELAGKIEAIEKSITGMAAKMENYGEPEAEKGFFGRVIGAIKSSDFGGLLKKLADTGEVQKDAEIKTKYSIASGRTGTVLISGRSNKLGEVSGAYKPHMRDIIPVTATDMPLHYFDQIATITVYPDINSENGDAVAVDFTTTEKSVSVSRIAGIQDISKRVLKSIQWITSWLMRRLPENFLTVEDREILFGTGTGNSLDGIMKNAQNFVLGNIKTFAAGAVPVHALVFASAV